MSVLLILATTIIVSSSFCYDLHRGTDSDYCGKRLCPIGRPDCARILSTRDRGPLKCLNGYRLCRNLIVKEKIVLDVNKFDSREYRTVTTIRSPRVYHLPSTPSVEPSIFRWKLVSSGSGPLFRPNVQISIHFLTTR